VSWTVNIIARGVFFVDVISFKVQIVMLMAVLGFNEWTEF